MATNKRKVEVLVISDVHLGTYGSQARQLNHYLDTIDPGKIIINGDWLDIWHFDANYWPESHTRNIFKILELAARGIEVTYLTGNHDDLLRQFSPFQFQNIELVDDMVLELDGKSHWILHGDLYDPSVQSKAKWLAKLGGKGYDQMIRANRGVNAILRRMGRDSVSFSKTMKSSVKRVVKSTVSNFEDLTCIEGIKRGHDRVLCGHVHRPQDRIFTHATGEIHYLNSGDWVENGSSLEYNNGEWKLYNFKYN